jgi:hypothetical protein
MTNVWAVNSGWAFLSCVQAAALALFVPLNQILVLTGIDTELLRSLANRYDPIPSVEVYLGRSSLSIGQIAR